MKRGVRLSIVISIVWVLCAFPLSAEFDEVYSEDLKDKIFSYFLVALPVLSFWGWRWVSGGKTVDRELLWGASGMALWGAFYIDRDLAFLPPVMCLFFWLVIFSQADRASEPTVYIRRISQIIGLIFVGLVGVKYFGGISRASNGKASPTVQSEEHLCDSRVIYDQIRVYDINKQYAREEIDAALDFPTVTREFNSMTKVQQRLMCEKNLNAAVTGYLRVQEVEASDDFRFFLAIGELFDPASDRFGYNPNGVHPKLSLWIDKTIALRIKKGSLIQFIGTLSSWGHIRHDKMIYPILDYGQIIAVQKDFSRHRIGDILIFEQVSTGSNQVHVNYSPIPELDAPIVSVHRYFDERPDSPVLFFISEGGTACAGEFRFLRKKEEELEVSEAFGTCSDTPKITENSREILVDLPSKKGTKRFTYSNGKVAQNSL